MTDESKPKVVEPWVRDLCELIQTKAGVRRDDITHEKELTADDPECRCFHIAQYARSRPAVIGPSTTGTPVHPVTRTAPPSSDPAPAPGGKVCWRCGKLWRFPSPSCNVADLHDPALAPALCAYCKKNLRVGELLCAECTQAARDLDEAPAPRETAGAVAPDVAALLREAADALEEIAKGCSQRLHVLDRVEGVRQLIHRVRAFAPALIARLRAAEKGGA